MIGSTASQTLDLTIINKGDTIYSTNQIKVEIGLKVGSTIEYILMGYYNIDDVEKNDYTIKFTAFDNMIKFETPYFSSLGDTPTLTQVVNELASKTGVQFVGSLPAYNVKKLEGFTCREILSYVASVCGGNSVITRDGKFTIVYPKDINYSIDANNYIDLKREEVKYKVGKVTCQIKEKETISKGSLGTDSMELLFENPWISETILTDIYNRLNGFEYLGYSLKWQGDLSLDVGDIITCTDVKSVVRKLPILSQKFTYTGGLTSEVAAKGESKNKNSFSSSGSMGNKVNRVVTEVALINKAFIDYAHINDADIVNLKAQTAKIQTIEAETANINNILAGNIGAGSTQTIHLTAKNVTMEDVFIKELIASKISVGDLLASDISTNKFRIVSDSGKMLIADNTIQIKDANRTRVQIGKDASNDYNMYVWDSTGKLMFDATGLKADGIKSKIIRDDMVSDTANINGSKINISSLVTEVNKDTNTQLIKASKVALDTTGQSLEISFNSLKSNIDNKESRNLILNGNFKNKLTNWIKNGGVVEVIEENKRNVLRLYANDTSGNRGINQTFNIGNVKSNEDYTLSLMCKKGQLDGNFQYYIWYLDSNNSRVDGFSKVLNTTNEYSKLISTFKVPNNNNIKSLRIFIYCQEFIPTELFIYDIKVEKGINENPIYSEAPEDIEQKIESNTTSIKVINGLIETLVKDTKIEDNGTTVKLQDFYSTFKQTSKDINFKVESLETMKIGARNLLLNSGFTKGTTYWNTYSSAGFTAIADESSKSGYIATFNSTGGGIYQRSGGNPTVVKPYEKGAKLIISGYFKCASTAALNIGLEGTKTYSFIPSSANTWTYFELEVVANGTSSTWTFYGVNGNTYFLKDVKVEEGNKATTWTPSPEDVDQVISGIETRLKTAELKITDSEIIATVSSTINNAKTEAINSANSTTDTKLKNYATTSSLTQTADSITAKFSSSGGYNVVKNGGFKNGLSGWWEGIYNPNGTNRSVSILNDTNEWVLDGTYALVMRSTNNTTGEFRTDSQKFKVKKFTNYTISYLVAAHRVTEMGHYIRGNEWEVLNYTSYCPKSGGKNRNDWTRITKTFNSGNNYKVSINFAHFKTGNDAYSWVTDVIINEGDIALPWSPHPSEIYEGYTTIDGSGVTIRNGAIKVQNNAGTNVLTGDSNGNLTISGTFINRNWNNVKAIQIDNTNITFYDWERNERELGYIYSSFISTAPNCRGFSLAHHNEGYLTLGYRRTDGTYGNYIVLDKYSKVPYYPSAIRVSESAFFDQAVNFQSRVYMPNNLYFGADVSNTTPLMFRNTKDSRSILCTQVSVNAVEDGYMIQTNTGGVLFSILAGMNYPIWLRNNTQVSGDFYATGSKNSLQTTKNYGERLINAYETAEYYFGDIGSGIIKDGECIVYIDEIFQECINTNCEYHVFTQVYEGSISSIKRYDNYFIIYGEEGTKFSWELKAKRIDYENVRLDTVGIEGYLDNTPVFTDEDLITATSEEVLMQELDFKLEDILMEG